MTRTVRLPEGVLRVMLRHATVAMPEECCGLLFGRGDDIIEAVPARNIAPDRLRRFLVDPADHFKALRRGRSAGLSLLGAYHSHPHGEPRPSETDVAEAPPDDGFIHLIVAPVRDEFAAYVFIQGNFVPLPLVRMP